MDWINLNIWTFGWAHTGGKMKATLRTATKDSTVFQTVKIPETPVWFYFKFESSCPSSKLNYTSFPLCLLYSCVRKGLSKFCVGSYLLWEAVGLTFSVGLHMCGDIYCITVGNRGTSSWTSSCKKSLSGPNKYNSHGLRIKFWPLSASSVCTHWLSRTAPSEQEHCPPALGWPEPCSENVPVFLNLMGLS